MNVQSPVRRDVQITTILGPAKAGDEVVEVWQLPNEAVMTTVKRYTETRNPLPSRPLTIVLLSLADKGEVWTDQAVLTLDGTWRSLATGKPVVQDQIASWTEISAALGEFAWELIQQDWVLDDRTRTWSRRSKPSTANR